MSGVRSRLGVCTPPIHFVGAGFKPPVIASECEPGSRIHGGITATWYLAGRRRTHWML